MLIEAIHELRGWAAKRQHVVWFEKPAAEWRFGLPVGNGRLGAMVLGTYPKERIQLNEDSIWAKEPLLRHPETTRDRIAEVQKLVEAGKYREAHDLYESEIIMHDAPPIGSYQTMGDLWIEHVGSAAAEPRGLPARTRCQDRPGDRHATAGRRVRPHPGGAQLGGRPVHRRPALHDLGRTGSTST